MSSQLTIKEYDTLAIVCEYQDDDGTPLNLDDTTIIADINATSGGLKESLSVDISSELGRFTLSRTVDHLALGSYRIDILFTNTVTGRRVASETFALNVDKSITLPRA